MNDLVMDQSKMSEIDSASKGEGLDAYQRLGYRLPEKPLFSPARFEALKAIFEETIQDPSKPLDTPHFEDERLLDFLLADEVLDVVETILGGDFGLWSSHFICKEPRVGKATPWHEDSAYWNGRFDRFGIGTTDDSLGGIVTIWLAIDESSRENGCMKVIPGSHHNQEAMAYQAVDERKNIFGAEAQGVDEEQAVYFERKPNQYSLHDSRILHGAEANRSNKRRCGYTMRYFSQNMKFNREHPDNAAFKLWHARGRNPFDNPVVN